MKYRNVKTGAVVDVDCELGGAWEPVKAPRSTGTTKGGRKSKEEPKKPKETAEPEKEETK